MDLTLTLLTGTFSLHRLNPKAEIPPPALHSPFFAIMRTPEELSLVLPDRVAIRSETCDPDWACFKVEGPLAFDLVGVLAGITGVMAKAGLPIFALSTFNTDYILVKREQARAAAEALQAAGYRVRPEGA